MAPSKKSRSKASSTDPGAAQSAAWGSLEISSDEGILKARKGIEAFQAVDQFTKYLGAALWASSVLWFIFCGDHAPVQSVSFIGHLEPSLGLAAAGSFCWSLSKVAPTAKYPAGLWSPWRKLWHVLWCVGLGFVALVVGFRGAGRPDRLIGGICGLMALAGASVVPMSEPPLAASGSWTSVWAMARLLMSADGVFLIVMSATAAMGTEWKHRFGPSGMACGAVPAAMLGLGLLLSRTEAEVLCAIPVAMFYCSMIVVRALVDENTAGLVPAACLLVVHGSLYLPLPITEKELNPFYKHNRKQLKAFMKLLASPDEAFGHETEESGS